MKWMGLTLALAVVLGANGFVLFRVAGNRSGEPEAVIRLTERELSLSRAGEENTGVSLRLQWGVRGAEEEGPGWFGRAKLEELGFDCSLSWEDPSAGKRYRNALPLERYAVLEYEGAAWEEWLAWAERDLASWTLEVERGERTPESLEERREWLEISRKMHSRLFVVDVGNDPAELRERYPDRTRYFFAPAIVRLELLRRRNAETGMSEPRGLKGSVSEILVDRIHVPLGKRSVLDALPEEEEEVPPRLYGFPVPEPRYSVTLHYGKSFEPWIAGIRPLGPAGSPPP